MENEKDFEVKMEDVEVLNGDGEPLNSKKPNIFVRAWNGVKRFPRKHPTITAGLAVVGSAALGYLIGRKFNASDDDSDDEENYGKLEFNSENDVDDETEEFNFEVDDEETEEEVI